MQPKRCNQCSFSQERTSTDGRLMDIFLRNLGCQTTRRSETFATFAAFGFTLHKMSLASRLEKPCFDAWYRQFGIVPAGTMGSILVLRRVMGHLNVFIQWKQSYSTKYSTGKFNGSISSSKKPPLPRSS